MKMHPLTDQMTSGAFVPVRVRLRDLPFITVALHDRGSPPAEQVLRNWVELAEEMSDLALRRGQNIEFAVTRCGAQAWLEAYGVLVLSRRTDPSEREIAASDVFDALHRLFDEVRRTRPHHGLGDWHAEL